MLSEVVRLLVGVALLGFHRPIADFILDLDHSCVAGLRAVGFNLPAPPRRSVMHTIYFCLGMFVSIFAMVKLYAELPR